MSWGKEEGIWKQKQRETYLFKISIEKIICGWNIHNSTFTFANILIELASFAVYKSRIIYNDTNKITPISILFMLEITKIDEIISNSKRKLRVKVEKQDLDYCKIYWNNKWMNEQWNIKRLNNQLVDYWNKYCKH